MYRPKCFRPQTPILRPWKPGSEALGCLEVRSLAALQQGLVRAPELAHGNGKVHVALHAQQVVPVVLPHVVVVIHHHYSSVHRRQTLPHFDSSRGPIGSARLCIVGLLVLGLAAGAHHRRSHIHTGSRDLRVHVMRYVCTQGHTHTGLQLYVMRI